MTEYIYAAEWIKETTAYSTYNGECTKIYIAIIQKVDQCVKDFPFFKKKEENSARVYAFLAIVNKTYHNIRQLVFKYIVFFFLITSSYYMLLFKSSSWLEHGLHIKETI